MFVSGLAVADVHNQVRISVKFHGKPLKGLRLSYWDSGRDSTITAVTNDAGIATITVLQKFDLFNLTTDCSVDTPCDFVLRNIRGSGHMITAIAVHSQQWQARRMPRVCDQLALVEDIVRGSLAEMSANEYDEWYSDLSASTISDCETLSAIQTRMKSLAPWYFYEFKGLPQNCHHDELVAELDWTAWYRELLEKETGVHPGKCVEAWDRWWLSAGYSAVPTPIDRKRLEMNWP